MIRTLETHEAVKFSRALELFGEYCLIASGGSPGKMFRGLPDLRKELASLGYIVTNGIYGNASDPLMLCKIVACG